MKTALLSCIHLMPLFLQAQAAELGAKTVRIWNVTEDIVYQTDKLSVRPGHLIELDASGFGDGSYSWMLANDSRKFSVHNDNRTVSFATGLKKKDYIFVLAVALDGQPVSQYKLTISVGGDDTDDDDTDDDDTDDDDTDDDDTDEPQTLRQKAYEWTHAVGATQAEIEAAIKIIRFARGQFVADVGRDARWKTLASDVVAGVTPHLNAKWGENYMTELNRLNDAGEFPFGFDDRPVRDDERKKTQAVLDEIISGMAEAASRD